MSERREGQREQAHTPGPCWVQHCAPLRDGAVVTCQLPRGHNSPHDSGDGYLWIPEATVRPATTLEVEEAIRIDAERRRLVERKLEAAEKLAEALRGEHGLRVKGGICFAPDDCNVCAALALWDGRE